MIQVNLSKKQKQTQVENRLMVAREGGDGMDWEFGTGRCKLLHMEWVNNILLYSTEIIIFIIL